MAKTEEIKSLLIFPKMLSQKKKKKKTTNIHAEPYQSLTIGRFMERNTN